MAPDDRFTSDEVSTVCYPDSTVSLVRDGGGDGGGMRGGGMRGRSMTVLSDLITEAIDEVTAAELRVVKPAFETRKRSMTILSDLITDAIDEAEAFERPRATQAFYWRTDTTAIPDVPMMPKAHKRDEGRDHVRSASNWSIDSDLVHTEARRRHWMKKL